MIDNIPIWLAVPLILVFGLIALYEYYIEPGYLKDRESRDSQNGAK